MILGNPFAGAFGLDIGDLSIKLIRLKKIHRWRRPDFYSVDELRSINLPPGYIVNGELQQPEMVRKKILYLLGKEGKKWPEIKSPWVVADLPEPKTFLKLIEVDTPPDQVTLEDVRFHARQHLPYNLDETYLDWQLVNPAETGSQKSQILIAGVPKVTADAYTYLLNSVGLTPIALEIEALALARALITADKSYTGEARMILDLGATRSGVVVYDNNSLQFSANLNFSGEILTMAISQELKLDYDAAENLKINNGLTYDEANPRYLPIINRVVDQLVEEINKTINFYYEHFNHTNPVTHITMCGGLARLKNIDNTLTQKLKITAHPGHPWKNLLNPHFSESENMEALGMASAIGLALRSTEDII